MRRMVSALLSRSLLHETHRGEEGLQRSKVAVLLHAQRNVCRQYRQTDGAASYEASGQGPQQGHVSGRQFAAHRPIRSRTAARKGRAGQPALRARALDSLTAPMLDPPPRLGSAALEPGRDPGLSRVDSAARPRRSNGSGRRAGGRAAGARSHRDS
jgi:hypothetical protein